MSFNSNMVRFKVNWKMTEQELNDEFQFQYGSIYPDTRRFQISTLMVNLISDLKLLLMRYRDNSNMVRFKVSDYRLHSWIAKRVSIPTWFDLKLTTARSRHAIVLVSIPIWFDLKSRQTTTVRSRLTTFQFQYGSI